MSIMASLHSRGSIIGEGIPDCREVNSSMTSLILHRSWKTRHLSFPGFFITKTGVFQGLFDGTMCPLDNCSATRDSNALSFSSGRGH